MLINMAKIQSIEFLPLEKSQSLVWRFFGFPARDRKFTEPDKFNIQLIIVIVVIVVTVIVI